MSQCLVVVVVAVAGVMVVMVVICRGLFCGGVVGGVCVGCVFLLTRDCVDTGCVDTGLCGHGTGLCVRCALTDSLCVPNVYLVFFHVCVGLGLSGRPSFIHSAGRQAGLPR